MPQLGVEQQFILLSQRLGSHIRGKLRDNNAAAAREALDRFGGFVADELRGQPQERTGHRLDTDPPPPSAGGMSVAAPDDDEPAEGDILPAGYHR